ncbi:MAG: hypothetical protein M3N26_05420 [Pseudomonadota bacterium]|nr:hypothetical protein [Pseudomonadota bacterium]
MTSRKRRGTGWAIAFGVIVASAGVTGAALYGLGQATPTVAQPTASIVACPKVATVVVGTVTVPEGPIARFCQAELINAAHIINAARAQGIGTHTMAIGVMTAIAESGLVNLAHGDAAGPDSRGLFQQRANGAWGTLTDRMTPYIAATNFFDKLVSLPNWKSLTPAQAAHAVQVNADANYYAQYWPTAVAIVAALTG